MFSSLRTELRKCNKFTPVFHASVLLLIMNFKLAVDPRDDVFVLLQN